MMRTLRFFLAYPLLRLGCALLPPKARERVMPGVQRGLHEYMIHEGL